MRKTLLAAVVTLCWAAGTAHAATGDGLDGTNWKMRENSFKGALLFWTYDHLTFKDGKFLSVDCQNAGYPPAPYAVTKTADGYQWSAALAGEGGGKVAWEGTRKGDKLDGKYTWTKPDGKTKVIRWGARQVFHEHPEHPTGPAKASQEHPKAQEHPTSPTPAGQEHPKGQEQPKGQKQPK